MKKNVRSRKMEPREMYRLMRKKNETVARRAIGSERHSVFLGIKQGSFLVQFRELPVIRAISFPGSASTDNFGVDSYYAASGAHDQIKGSNANPKSTKMIERIIMMLMIRGDDENRNYEGNDVDVSFGGEEDDDGRHRVPHKGGPTLLQHSD